MQWTILRPSLISKLHPILLSKSQSIFLSKLLSTRATSCLLQRDASNSDLALKQTKQRLDLYSAGVEASLPGIPFRRITLQHITLTYLLYSHFAASVFILARKNSQLYSEILYWLKAEFAVQKLPLSSDINLQITTLVQLSLTTLIETNGVWLRKRSSFQEKRIIKKLKEHYP